jgi:hypothetical protein
LIGNFKKELDKKITVVSTLEEPLVTQVLHPSLTPHNQLSRNNNSMQSAGSIRKTVRRIQTSKKLMSDGIQTSKKLIRPTRTRRTNTIKQPVIRENLEYVFYSSNGDLNKKLDAHIDTVLRPGSILIVDESQLLISKIASAYVPDGYGSTNPFYHFYTTYLQKYDKYNLKMICLSGTPIITRAFELAILFNLLSGKKVFDLAKFEKEFNVVYTPNTSKKIQSYKYSLLDETNALRIQNMQNINDHCRVNNDATFIANVRGLISYFGNIKTLLPRIRLSDTNPDNRRGYNNDGDELFLIKMCPMSDEQYAKITIIESITKKTDPNAKNVVHSYVSNIHAMSYDFAMTIDNPNDIATLDTDKTHNIQILQRTVVRDENINHFFTNNMTTYRTMVENPTGNNAIPSNEDMKSHSIKIYEICKHIRENPNRKHIVYCESRRVNVILARALRKYMNYTEFTGTNPSINETSSSFMYMFLTGKGSDMEDFNNVPDTTDDDVILENTVIDGVITPANNKPPSKKATANYIKYTEGQFRGNDVQKEKMIDAFNAAPIRSKLNVTILNSAAAEGITLKKVNFVHLLQVPANMSRLYQIVGRAIRNCTHTSLDDEDRFVTPILYIATHPQIEPKKNADINKYNKIVRINDNNIPYLNLLKRASIDCALTQQIPGNESLECSIIPNCPENNRTVPSTQRNSRKRRRSGDTNALFPTRKRARFFG